MLYQSDSFRIQFMNLQVYILVRMFSQFFYQRAELQLHDSGSAWSLNYDIGFHGEFHYDRSEYD